MSAKATGCWWERGAASLRAYVSGFTVLCNAGTKKLRFPATSNFLTATLVDWSREKHIHGGYTYPSLHAQVGDRDMLAQPIGNTVFFAGEATHPAINPCMQAAMETGQRAADEILTLKLRSASSKL